MTRPRKTPIKVYVTEGEREIIADLAKSANLSLSNYLRAAGMNQPVRSVFDIQAVNELAKLNGELGRCAEMFKPILEFNPLLKLGTGTDVTQLVKELRELQKQSHEIMGRRMR